MTAGNTGAALVAAKVVIGTVPGVDRPALAAVVPNETGRTVLLDVGANVDSRAVHLREFAVMGHAYAQEVLGVDRPRVGLLSIGEEEGKGSDLTREVFRVLQETGLEFVGNVEGSDVFSGGADVVVCDGFVGNAVLKSAEALADLATRMLAKELQSTWRTRVGYCSSPGRRSSASHEPPTTPSTARRRSSASTGAASSPTAARTRGRSRAPCGGRWSSPEPRSRARSASAWPRCTTRSSGCSGIRRRPSRCRNRR